MDSIAMLQRTVDRASALIHTVRPDELTKPTPCTDWDVTALIRHMVSTCAMFTSGAEGAKVEMPAQEPADVSAGDLADSYAENSRRLLDA